MLIYQHKCSHFPETIWVYEGARNSTTWKYLSTISVVILSYFPISVTLRNPFFFVTFSKMPIHPHYAGVTRILNSSYACWNICLFTRNSTLLPTFLAHWIFLSKKFEEYCKPVISSHWSDVLCTIQSLNQLRLWASFKFHAKKEKKLYQGGQFKQLLEQKHLLDWNISSS